MRQLFIALIRPHLEFANVAWSPRYQKDKDLIEGVLRRATKMVPGLANSTCEERLARMKIPSMQYRRGRGDMIEVYKFTHGLYEVESPLVLGNSNRPTRGHNLRLKKRPCNGQMRQHYFSFRVVNPWNTLPDSVVSAPSLNTFKARLDNHWAERMYK
ncbi:uncharacterized protein LOC143289651 [Babylonia areolata]|uniref:uncharacterized protein LOC143289651 n=1 Tax=Babylonia areolata TaxID=304850 RepID=UPI003FCF2424